MGNYNWKAHYAVQLTEQEHSDAFCTYEIEDKAGKGKVVSCTIFPGIHTAFATKDPARFYKELLGTKTAYLKNNNKDWSMSDMWLGLALGIGYGFRSSGLLQNYNMRRGFDEGEYYDPEETAEGKVYGKRIDPVNKGSLKEAEDYMTEQIF